jgi:hypothetical protein
MPLPLLDIALTNARRVPSGDQVGLDSEKKPVVQALGE